MLSFVVVIAAAAAAAPAPAAAAAEYAQRALFLADRMAACAFAPALGVFLDEQLWQSGASLETMANALLADPPPRLRADLAAVFAAAFSKTPVIVDNCFDDHQWWGLAWARGFAALRDPAYLARSAAIFDFVAQKGWEEALCGGGVTWCPPPTSPYKNAITAELFLSLAMALHPHAAALNRSASFFSGWASRVHGWLAASGMQNAEGLLNDGLNSATCENNGQTTWSYNQGVLLSGLYRLSAATGDAAPLAMAVRVANATMALLTIDGVLTEPCPGGSCGQDGQIFKGMFVKHLGYLLAEDAAAAPPLLPAAFAAQAAAFLAANARALLASDGCADLGYGFRWAGSACDVESTATDSAALDLLLGAAAAGAPPPAPPPAWRALGVGNCADDAGASMANCFADGAVLQACEDAAYADAGAVAFDFHAPCLGGGKGFCRVRTRSTSCPGGFSFEGGSASGVTRGDGSALAMCFLRS